MLHNPIFKKKSIYIYILYIIKNLKSIKTSIYIVNSILLNIIPFIVKIDFD